MVTWAAMVNSRDRHREGARGAQRTYRGGVPEGAYTAGEDLEKLGCWLLIGPSPLLRSGDSLLAHRHGENQD